MRGLDEQSRGRYGEDAPVTNTEMRRLLYLVGLLSMIGLALLFVRPSGSSKEEYMLAEVRSVLEKYEVREGREQAEGMPVLAAWMQNLAILGEEVLWDSFVMQSFVEGNGAFKDRRLGAAIVEVSGRTVNRSEGEYGTLCVEFAALEDREFGMWREILVQECGEDGERLKKWMERVDFKPVNADATGDEG